MYTYNPHLSGIRTHTRLCRLPHTGPRLCFLYRVTDSVLAGDSLGTTRTKAIKSGRAECPFFGFDWNTIDRVRAIDQWRTSRTATETSDSQGRDEQRGTE